MSLTPAELDALRLSLLVASVGTAASLLPALGIAWVLARYRFPGKILLDGLIHLPLVLPPVVIGYILLVGLGRRGVIGAWLYESFGITFAFTWKGAAIVAAVMGFPLLVRALRLSIETLDDGLVGAARTLGAGPFRAFMTVTLPLITPGLLTGAILALPARWGNSAPPSRSSAISPARRRPCLSRFIQPCNCQGAKKRPGALSLSRRSLPWLCSGFPNSVTAS